MATGQRARKPKTSKGTGRGGPRTNLDGITKVLFGQGFYRNVNKPNFGKKRRDV